MAAYTWQGITRHRGGQTDATDIAPADLPAWVETRYRQGWPHPVLTAANNWHAERA
jgi:hypothetical protein